MGAEHFIARGFGPSATAAFAAAVEQARYEYGHSGYTGTIAEKDDFVRFDVPDGLTLEQFLRFVSGGADVPEELAAFRGVVRDAATAIEDKWGPAGCVQLGPDEFLFFGLASS